LSLIELLFCYGLTFGMMNKTSYIQNRVQIIDDLLSCSYCTGFHAGWISLLILEPSQAKDIQTLLLWSITSSSFSYIIDTLMSRLEEY